MLRFRLTLSAALTLAAVPALADVPEKSETPTFEKVDINPRSVYEAAGAFDVDGDKDLDIVSGDTWYEAPNWTPHKVRDWPRVGTYLNCFATLPVDADKDGDTDFVTCSYFGKDVAWVENPGKNGGEWAYHEIDLPGPSEAAVMIDLTGDGQLDFLPNTVNNLVFYSLDTAGPEPKFGKHQFPKEYAAHGVGTGDINQDGRIDLLTPKGWLEAPENRQSDEGWTWHPDWNLGATGIQILGKDVDADGDVDLVYGMGHNYGLFWLEQTKGDDGKAAWTRHEIDPSVASVHTLLWADLNNDGQADELVTGKRVYAHEIEPGATDGSVVAWYGYDKGSKSWKRHVIFEGQAAKNAPPEREKRDAQKDFPPGTAGTGLQVTAIDLDADGDLDLLCPGKS
ncbi:MAG TPA: VCBS repeat-containing protein, partial [Isosphaeraceae bacterium]|nr:VCBS repeat-containing protein [Isosphaeraceae bacterium]